MENERQKGIPIDPLDVRQTTEVPIKHIEVETIEYVGKPVKTKKERKTRTKKSEKIKKPETEDYELELKRDSILIITEKPQAAHQHPGEPTGTRASYPRHPELPGQAGTALTASKGYGRPAHD